MSLVLDSLEIKNFRAFKHLQIEKLGRVNLIVGKNNVGKSSLLEALFIYLKSGQMYEVMRLMNNRNEMRQHNNAFTRRELPLAEERASAFRYLFYNRENIVDASDSIEIGPLENLESRLTIRVEWMATAQPIVDQQAKLSGLQTSNISSSRVPHIVTRFGNGYGTQYPLDIDQVSRLIFWPTMPSLLGIEAKFVKANGLEGTEVGVLWDAIALSDAEKEVVLALQIIAPEVEAVSLVGDEGVQGTRIPKARLKNIAIPLPLRSMGEGMNRMFGIALALVNAKDGMLLIDEVDTGLHYSVLPDLWKLIFEVAHRLNVQVFATSHSWDCIQAFQSAAEENKEEEGIVIRLETQDGEVVPVTFDERKLSIATREQIEVR